MTGCEGAPMAAWLAEPLPQDVEAAVNRLRRSDDVQRVAVMPDVHLASDVCIGTVVATRYLLYPNAVGGDIGCGMAAVGFDGSAEVLSDRRIAGRILAGFTERVPINKHRSRRELPKELRENDLSHPALNSLRDRDGRVQLGTLGRGNHFLELQSCEEGRLWLMVHSGSRGTGQRIRDHHLHRCQRAKTGLKCLNATQPDGQAYLHDMAWALAYAEQNRRAIMHAASEVIRLVTGLDAQWENEVSCHHNHVERIGHEDEQFWVHRKGAIPAGKDQSGIIPGSMRDPSFHVRGKGEARALWSSSHGAGRAMSRTQARKQFSVRALENQAAGVWFDHRIAKRLVDEAPRAYKDITKVMRAQRELTSVVRRLTPLLSFKGG